MRIAGQPAIRFRILDVVQDIDDAGPANAGGVVDARVFEIEVLAKLLRAVFGEDFHVVFGAEVQAASWAGLDTGWFEAHCHTVRAQRALEHLLCARIELRNIKRASANAIAATDAILLLKIDDAVGVLNDCAVGRARCQAARICAVHALIFSHQ